MPQEKIKIHFGNIPIQSKVPSLFKQQLIGYPTLPKGIGRFQRLVKKFNFHGKNQIQQQGGTIHCRRFGRGRGGGRRRRR